MLSPCYGQHNSHIVPVEGIYLAEGSDAGRCQLEIRISKKGTGYVYQVITDKRNQQGQVTLLKEEKETYIRFVGLKAEENNGDLQGLLADDTITIQNTGNAMNYYVRLSECDRKYIMLVKQPLSRKK